MTGPNRLDAEAVEIERSALDAVPAADLDALVCALGEGDRDRLEAYWSDVIAEAGADLSSSRPRRGPDVIRRPVPLNGEDVRARRREARRRADRLRRALPGARAVLADDATDASTPADATTGGAAA